MYKNAEQDELTVILDQDWIKIWFKNFMHTFRFKRMIVNRVGLKLVVENVLSVTIIGPDGSFATLM